MSTINIRAFLYNLIVILLLSIVAVMKLFIFIFINYVQKQIPIFELFTYFSGILAYKCNKQFNCHYCQINSFIYKNVNEKRQLLINKNYSFFDNDVGLMAPYFLSNNQSCLRHF